MAFDGKQIRGGTIVGAKLAPLTITSGLLAVDAVITEKIADAAVVESKLADGSVIAAKIAANAVTAAKLAGGAVTTAKLDATALSEAVTTETIRASAVTTAKIANDAVTLDKLAANSVDGTKIADGSVSLAKLAADSVDSSKIVNGSITGADIGSNTVTKANLVTAYEDGLFYHDGSRPISGTIDLGTGNRIINLANPEQAQDAATKAYVDAVTAGLDLKASVRAATTGSITLSNGATVDTVVLANNDRVLVKNQTDAKQNGIWVVNTSGAWARSIDANSSAEVTSGLFTFVEEGIDNGTTGWVLTTNNPIALETDALAFTQFSGAGSYLADLGIVLNGNSFSADFNDTDVTVTEVLATTDAGDSDLVARADHSHALANNAVTADKIANDAVTEDKILDGSITADKLDVDYADLLFLRDGSKPLSGDVDANNWIISGLGLGGTSNTDAATVFYVQESDKWALQKEPVLAATIANIDIASLIVTGAPVDIDGVNTGDWGFPRILVKNQTNAVENGIYVASTTEPWIRADDFDQQNLRGGEVRIGANVYVKGGNQNGRTSWTLSYSSATFESDIVIDTSTLLFTSFDANAVADTATNNTTLNNDGQPGSLSGARTLKIDASPFGYEGKALNDIDLDDQKIVNLADPDDAQDAATKAYVDGQIVSAGGGNDISDKSMVAAVTATNGALACETPMSFDAKGYVQVFVNGIKANVLGSKLGDCYFSADDGVNAKLLDSVRANDELYWNGSIAGYELASSDRIDFDYVADPSPG